MKTFLKPFEEMPQIEELREHLKKDKRIYEVSGLIDSLKPHLIYGIGYDVPIKLTRCGQSRSMRVISFLMKTLCIIRQEICSFISRTFTATLLPESVFLSYRHSLSIDRSRS